MMKSKNTKWFTLVELIIVITILAILATIAFISFQGYSWQSKDAKKQSELDNIRNKIEVSMASNGQSVTSFVSSGVTSSVNMAGTNTSWLTGSVNYAAFGGDASKYNYTYLIGAVTSTGGNFYQIGTKLDDNSTIYTLGNYSPRSIASYTGTVNGSGITLSSGVGMFRLGDTLSGATVWVITKVSSDLATITVSGTPTSPISLSGSTGEDKYLFATWAVTRWY